MPGCADLAVILLAAGEGRRFGGAKLEAELNGKMVGLHAAETLAGMGFGPLLAVCNPANARLNAAYAALGFGLITNGETERGQSHSIALGTEAVEGCDADGALVALADMPFVDAGHLQQLVTAFDAANGQHITCSSDGDIRMPPAIFPRTIWPEFKSLTGDQGARKWLADAIAIEAKAYLLADIDTPEDLPG